VAVPVGFDHHHGGGAGRCGAPDENPDIVPDRVEIDHHFNARTRWHRAHPDILQSL
jgi:hypothetical protein